MAKMRRRAGGPAEWYAKIAMKRDKDEPLDGFLTTGPVASNNHILLAHGAGAPMTSPFMTAMAERLAAAGLCVHRFEFAYMAERRTGGSRRPPPKAEALMTSYVRAVDAWHERRPPQSRLFIGGKSLGGRVASLVAGDLFETGRSSGLVCLGYPFHPPGQPDKLRTAHLAGLAAPALVVQGTRDPLGSREEIAEYDLASAITVHWVEGGNHDLKPPAKSGRTQDQELDAAVAAIARFVR